MILWCYISAITSGAARIPRMPWQGHGASSPAQRNRESVFPPARPHSAGSGECGALAASAVGGAIPPRLALRACPPLFSPALQPLRLLTWRRAWSPRCPRSSPARRWPRGRLAGGRRFVQVAAARQSVGFKKTPEYAKYSGVHFTAHEVVSLVMRREVIGFFPA